MENYQKAELVGEFCQAIYELRYKLRKSFQIKLKEAGINISFEMLEVMKILSKNESVNQQELADILFKDKSSMTYLIDNMVKGGWAVRKEHETDRRNKVISLTPASHQLRAQLVPMATDSFLKLAEEVTEKQVNEGLQMVFKMNSSLDEIILSQG